ncbi:MAG: hypothetical protein L7T85_06305 [Flavobacteriaceae bacterium]|nr:hypothetical protein [Flavobacteriaceae bacterium]
MTKPLLKLGGGLLIALSLAFVIHTTLMPDALWGQIRIMWLCYGFNFGLAVLIFWAVLATHKKNAMLVGVVFMGGSMFKFGLFFLLIYPDFKADGLVGRDELTLFFVPYLISLFSMTYAASRVLQRA